MKKPFIIAGVSLTSFFILSSFVSAQSASVTSVNQGIGTFASLITNFTQSIVKATGTLFMALAMVAFFYGIVQYIWGAREGDSKKIQVGNEFIKWSLVALFVMFSVYGIIRFFQVFICNGPCSETIIIPDINFGKSSNNGISSPPTGTDPLTTQKVYLCPDGITKLSTPDLSACPSTTYTCPDGVTKVSNQSDLKYCPQN